MSKPLDECETMKISNKTYKEIKFLEKLSVIEEGDNVRGKLCCLKYPTRYKNHFSHCRRKE